MRKIILLIVIVLVGFYVNAQTAPGIEWQNTIGGIGRDELSCGKSIIGGGYIFGGLSSSNISADKTENSIGNTIDYWAIKLDSTGNIIWQNTIGGNYSDYLTSIQVTLDGGFILGGYSNSYISADKSENCFNNSPDYWIVKLDSIGNIKWQNTIGGDDLDYLTCINQTNDGGYIVGGLSTSNISGDKTEDSNGSHDYWIIKIDSLGDIMWQNTIGGSGYDYCNSIEQTIDGGYIIGGQSSSIISGDKTENGNGVNDYWIIKTDSSGNIQWQNSIGGNYEEYLNSIHQTIDGGYIIGGSSISNISGDKSENSNGLYDYWIVKLNTAGNIQWQNTIGGSDWDVLHDIHQTLDSGFIFGGWSKSNISGDKNENNLGATLNTFDCWIVKTDSLGNIEWQNTIGGTFEDRLNSLHQVAEEGYILGGYSNSNISGDKTENCIGNYDYWIIKLSPDTITSITNLQSSINNLQLFPNPFTTEINISLKNITSNQPIAIKVFDVYGKEILMQQSPTPNYKLKTPNLTKGIYFVEVISGEKSYRAKMVRE